MNTEEKYYAYWLLYQDSALSDEDLASLNMYLNANPQKRVEWDVLKTQINLLKKMDFSFSESFELDVMNKWKVEKRGLYDSTSKMILYASVAAAVLLMLNLFISQNTMNLDALLGLADMNADNTSLLFYID